MRVPRAPEPEESLYTVTGTWDVRGEPLAMAVIEGTAQVTITGNAWATAVTAHTALQALAMARLEMQANARYREAS